MPILEIQGAGRIEVGDEFLKLSPEQQDATVQEIAGSLKGSNQLRPVAPDKPGIAEDMARSVPTGLAKGAAGLIGLPSAVGDVWNAGMDAVLGYVANKAGLPPEWVAETRAAVAKGREHSVMNHAPTTQGVVKGIEDIAGPLYKSQTTPGKYAETVSEFVPGAMIGGSGVLRNLINYAAVPGIASEAAGQLTQGTKAEPYEPYVRAGAALAGGGVSSAVNRSSNASRAIRRGMPEGVSQQHVDAAEALITNAANQGIALSWPEALSQVAGRPVLTNTMRHLEAAPSSEARMAGFFGDRAPAIDNAARMNFSTVAPVNNAPSGIGPAAGRAAEETVNDVRGAINRASDPMYTAAERQVIDPQTMARVRAAPGWDEASAAVRNDPQLNRYVAGLPDDSVGFLNEVKKYLDTAATNAAGKVNPQRNQQRAAGYGQDATAVRQAAIDASPAYERALQFQQQARERYLQPLLDGPLGKIAAKDTTTQKAINALFPHNPLPNSADEVSTAVSALAQRNPNAARDLVRAHMESTFNEASQALQSGANQAGGAKFRAVLVGNPQQAANLEASVRALPNGDQIWPGINRFLEVLEATGTRQNIGSKTAYNTEFLKQSGASGLIGETSKTAANPVRGLQFLADRYERWQLGRNLDDLARIFTDPRAGNLFRAISRMPVDSPSAISVAARAGMLIEASVKSEPKKISDTAQ